MRRETHGPLPKSSMLAPTVPAGSYRRPLTGKRNCIFLRFDFFIHCKRFSGIIISGHPFRYLEKITGFIGKADDARWKIDFLIFPVVVQFISPGCSQVFADTRGLHNFIQPGADTKKFEIDADLFFSADCLNFLIKIRTQSPDPLAAGNRFPKFNQRLLCYSFILWSRSG